MRSNYRFAGRGRRASLVCPDLAIASAIAHCRPHNGLYRHRAQPWGHTPRARPSRTSTTTTPPTLTRLRPLSRLLTPRPPIPIIPTLRYLPTRRQGSRYHGSSPHSLISTSPSLSFAEKGSPRFAEPTSRPLSLDSPQPQFPSGLSKELSPPLTEDKTPRPAVK